MERKSDMNIISENRKIMFLVEVARRQLFYCLGLDADLVWNP
jgi:hypothetical protein